MQSHPQSAQVCPFCAFTAMLAQFTLVAGPAQNAGLGQEQRRGPRRFAPSGATAPLSAQAPAVPIYAAPPVAQAAYYPSTPLPPTSPPTAAFPAPAFDRPAEAPHPTAAWPGLQPSPGELAFPSAQPTPPFSHQDFGANFEQPTNQGFLASSGQQGQDYAPGQGRPFAQPRFGTAPAPAMGSANWARSGLDEEVELEFPADSYVSRSRPGQWGLVALSILVLGLVFLLLRQPPAASPPPPTVAQAIQPPATPSAEQVARAVPVVAKVPTVPVTAVSVLSPSQATEKAQALLRALFTAQSQEDRLGCIADPSNYQASVETFFAAQPQPLQLVGLELFPTRVKRLPGGNPAPLFHVILNSGATVGSPLASLRSTPEGEVKLDWELFSDSFANTLAEFQKARPVNPRWFTVGLRKNHGLEEEPSVRESHLAFDLQCSFDGRDRSIALATKVSESSRSIDREAAWGELYLARVLLGWTPVNNEMRLTILDIGTISEEEIK